MGEQGSAGTRARRRPGPNSNIPRWAGAWLGSVLVTHTLIAYIASGVNHFGSVFGCCEFSSVLLVTATFTKIAHAIWRRQAGPRATLPIDILVLITLLCGTAGAVVMIGFYLLPFGLTPWRLSG